MGMISNPNVNKDSLVVSLDAANVRSFQGIARTNLARGVNYNQNNSNTSTYKYTQGTEVVNIPRIGLRTVKYVDHWNDYNGGSGQCCPSLFYYYDSVIPVSPSTTYTYSIIYKTTTGYTHPNFMYRYEYNSANTYLTEGGVHSTNNRIELGDGWYYAWGQFTTQSTTAYIITFLFYYQYATWDRIYVDRVSIVAGSTVPEPEHLTNYNSTNSGNWTDLSGNANHGEVVNGPTYNSDKGGSIVLDGTNDTITTPIPLTTLAALSNWTMECWVNIPAFPTAASPNGYGQTTRCGVLMGAAYYCGCALYWYGNGSGNDCTMYGYIRGNDAYRTTGGYSMSTNTWYHFAFVNSRSDTTMKLYVNGTLHSSVAGPTQEYNSGLTGTAGNIGFSKAQVDGGGEAVYSNFNCRIGGARIYNRALSASEVAQNFNSLRDRYGV
jgi:hypothetical protein